jgi:AraC-like DNA-binding protein
VVAPSVAGVALSRGEAGGLSWEVARRPLHPGLAGLVTAGYGYAEHAPRPLARRVTPHPALTVILSVGPTIDVNGTAMRSFVAGMHDTWGVTEFAGEQCGVELRVAPQGAYRLLGVPPGELTGQVAALPLLDRIADRAAAEPDWASRLQIVEAGLLRGLADTPDPDRAVAWAWRVLRARHGVVAIGDLAAEIGWSRRHFANRFRAEIGLPPKVAARVLRFERASALLVRGVPAASVSARCGYTDQSHLVREFRALAGCTPGAYVAELDPEQVTFVQDGQPAQS